MLDMKERQILRLFDNKCYTIEVDEKLLFRLVDTV